MRQSIYAIFALTAFLIVVDLVIPGKIINDEVKHLKKERQDYNNAANNYHYSYKVITSKHEFSVDEDFAKSIQKQLSIEYSVSRIFKEVNWYKRTSSENQSYPFLRVLSGLIIPLLTISAIVMAYRYKLKIDTFVFVLQVLLIADLVYLLM